MIRLIISVLALAAACSLHADNDLQKVLMMIEENNSTLKALRTTSDAQKLENRTGINLSDPELGFGYTWKNTPGVLDEKSVSLSQSFDFATISGLKSRVANKKNELVEWQYRSDRMKIMLEAKQYALDVIYYNAMLKELGQRKLHFEEIAEVQKKRLVNGEGNRLEYNNAQLNLLKLKGEIKRNQTEHDAALSQLVRLNGGNPVVLNDYVFEPVAMPADYEQWYEETEKKNPVLSYVRQEIEVSKKQLSLNKSMGLPSFTAGYSGDFSGDERSNGISIGLSIPLWSNKNRVRQAKTAVRAAEERHVDARLQYYNTIKIMFIRTQGLKDAADTFRLSLKEANNSELLKKALDEGQISLLDYFVEIGIYYDAVNEALDAEREYQKAYAELTAVEL